MLLFRCISRWLAGFALATTWLCFVAANPPAHSLEKTAYYYVYRSAVTAYGDNQQKIAPGLKQATSHPDGGANYREFVNHISMGKKTFTDADFTNAGVDLKEPDVEKATKFLLQNGGSSQVNAQMLRPKQGAKYWDQIPKMRKVLEKSYTKMKADGKDTSVLDGNKDKILACIDEVDVVRKSDTLSSQPGATTTKGLINDIGKLVPGAVLKLDQSFWKWDSSRTIYTPNLKDTLTASVAGTFANTKEIKDAVRNYGKTSSGGYDPAYTHYKVHKAYRKFGKKVRKNC